MLILSLCSLVPSLTVSACHQRLLLLLQLSVYRCVTATPDCTQPSPRYFAVSSGTFRRIGSRPLCRRFTGIDHQGTQFIRVTGAQSALAVECTWTYEGFAPLLCDTITAQEGASSEGMNPPTIAHPVPFSLCS